MLFLLERELDFTFINKGNCLTIFLFKETIMKIRVLQSIPISLLLLLTLAIPPAGSSLKTDTITVNNFRLEKRDYKSTDYGWYLLKCDVANTSDKSGTVGVTLRSIDKFAYYRKDIQLWGHLEAGHTATLSLNSFMDHDTLQDIRKWKVKSIEIQ